MTSCYYLCINFPYVQNIGKFVNILTQSKTPNICMEKSWFSTFKRYDESMPSYFFTVLSLLEVGGM